MQYRVKRHRREEVNNKCWFYVIICYFPIANLFIPLVIDVGRPERDHHITKETKINSKIHNNERIGLEFLRLEGDGRGHGEAIE